MEGLLAYGSLMDPAEIASSVTRAGRAVPVRVGGFRRSFCQEPSWRRGEGESRGVLTVRPESGAWFNAILLEEIGADALQVLDRRERGYHRIVVPHSLLRQYDGNPLGTRTSINLYIGKDEKRNDALLPNPAYLRLCTSAAEQWGDEYATDFLDTTFVGHTRLSELSQQSGRCASDSSPTDR